MSYNSFNSKENSEKFMNLTRYVCVYVMYIAFDQKIFFIGQIYIQFIIWLKTPK